MARPGRETPVLQPRLRLDKWLFFARFFRSRQIATDMIKSGQLRLNGQHCQKPDQGIACGDVLTFVQADRIRVIRVLGLAPRREQATKAQLMYQSLDPAAHDISSPLE